ncbi:uncharacterized protein [Hyperolius riggenbachi]|uniref:uncharacterized protein n=1 Tax=Hyperolius riggenbachi TaxID=752182 RepID=UPI0035A35140
MEVIDNEERFWSQKDRAPGVMLMLMRPTCPYCKRAMPAAQELASKYTRVTCLAADIEKIPNLLAVFGANGVPTFIFMQSGEEVSRVVGADMQTVENTLDQLSK